MDIAKNWKRTGKQRRSGILVPLFSVYSRNSFGIGDFADLKLLVDWCVKTGNSIIRLLPLNEVGSNYTPYESLSSFALEPMYAAVGRGANVSVANRKRVDYGIKKKKLEMLRRLYLDRGGSLWTKEADFREKNSWWIEDFALYNALKKNFSSAPWYNWPEPYKHRDSAALARFASAHREEIDFEIWLQNLLCGQLMEAKSYAAERGVLLGGDMPVLVNRDSADVWAHPEFFNMDLAAGAPPDMFSPRGQRWGNPGMPTWNRKKIAEDGYSYIKEKLRYAGQFYDILRIDHIVGFFRIWSVPLQEPIENEGLNGFFDPPDEKLWEQNGREMLSFMLDNTEMLLSGEDLGVIPPACPAVMEELGVPGIDVQRWKKNWDGDRGFLSPGQYRFLSESALSTHDTSNWNEWWEQETSPEEKCDFWKLMGKTGSPVEKASPGVLRSALEFIMKTRSVFSVQLIFDWINLCGIAGENYTQLRVNKPGTISEKNWSAVVPVPLEEILRHRVCEEMLCLVEESGRRR